jgi:processive 1,2-diacylglycerol beta-glucosyltransferase
MSNGRALLLTPHTGGGHISLAEALAERLNLVLTCEISDPEGAAFSNSYNLVTRYAPWVWEATYAALNRPWLALQVHRVKTRIVARTLDEALRHGRPSIVLSTYSWLTYEALRRLERSTPRVPFAMLFGDPLDLDASWFSERDADATFAPTRETYRQALAAGFDPARLHLTGWPVRAQFFTAGQTSRAETLTRLGLAPERFTVFLQGGGEGAARFARTVESVLAVGPQLQIILACGTNEAIRARFSGMPGIATLPFTKVIAPYMAAADVVMGKAGPNMLFEAVTLSKPFIATTYNPGQEAPNLRFIRKYGLGWVALRPDEQYSLLASLVEMPALLAEMATTVNTYRAWNTAATETIRPLVEALIATPIAARRSGS